MTRPFICSVNGIIEENNFNYFFENKSPENPYWIHLPANDPICIKQLKELLGLDLTLVEPMLSEKVRPRLISLSKGILLILRVSDSTTVKQHEELRSLRIYADKDRIITTSLYPLPVVEGVLRKCQSITTSADLLVDLCTQSVRGLEIILEDLDERADLLEKQVLANCDDPEDKDVTSLALDSLDVRRYLAPQKEVLYQLNNCSIPWITSAHQKKIRETHDRVSRQLEEAEALRERTRIIRDQLQAHVAEQVNHRVYVFSVIAAIFIPLGFLTGLFGVNLGGIPGRDSPIGFFLFNLILCSITILMVFVFKRLKWI